mmetsp:Transcript_110733/g.213297  ORF Transcript_110733/g.213297 Transcript_110733/m.213297 type:complete len:237 (+) Transcript_110733:70-780(+)
MGEVKARGLIDQKRQALRMDEHPNRRLDGFASLFILHFPNVPSCMVQFRDQQQIQSPEQHPPDDPRALAGLRFSLLRRPRQQRLRYRGSWTCVQRRNDTLATDIAAEGAWKTAEDCHADKHRLEELEEDAFRDGPPKCPPYVAKAYWLVWSHVQLAMQLGNLFWLIMQLLVLRPGHKSAQIVARLHLWLTCHWQLQLLHLQQRMQMIKVKDVIHGTSNLLRVLTASSSIPRRISDL